MTPLEIAWLAGLLEGEGSFACYRGTPEIEIKMVDRDVIERVSHLFGGVAIVERQFNRPNRQPQFRVRIRGERARLIMLAVLPHMGDRRSARIREVIPGMA